MVLLDVLGELLERADAPGEEADHFLVDDLGEYPEEHLAALVTSGLLVPGTPARTVSCPACSDEHWEEPEAMPGADPPGFIRCGRFGPQAIEPAQLERQCIDFTCLANHLAELLEAGRSNAPLIPGRLWRLGEFTVVSRGCAERRLPCHWVHDRIFESCLFYYVNESAAGFNSAAASRSLGPRFRGY